jgi:putative NIF3 family GTP cyclohydrolase 1 type 2
VALCGGSGAFLIDDAIKAEADAFICGDIKHHEFYKAEQKILLADIGHFESEIATKEIFFSILSKKSLPLSFTCLKTTKVLFIVSKTNSIWQKKK